MSNHPSLSELLPSLAPYLKEIESRESSPESPPPDSVEDLTESPEPDVRVSECQPVSVSPQTGPQSPEGKSISRLNSFKHGMDATDRIYLTRLSGNEQDAYKQIRRALRKFYGCADKPYEFMLIDRMAIQHLRMLRLYRLEAEVMEMSPGPEHKGSIVPHLDRFSRYDVRIEKQLRILHNRLISIFEQDATDKFKPFTHME